MIIHPFAGHLAAPENLINVAKLVTAYYTGKPDVSVASQRVVFGTSGHRGSSFHTSFNEAHVLAISQAICLYRQQQGINGPLFIGIDTHALSEPAFASALEVLAANGVEVMMTTEGEQSAYTPTPAVSHAILRYNQGRQHGLADGIIITPSHNPPEAGGIKYNAPNGGPADTVVTGWIQKQANAFLQHDLQGVLRMPYEQALRASSTHRYDFLHSYVDDLENVIDMDLVRAANIRMGVDPLGGAGVHYWAAIAERYRLDLDIVNPLVDATFRFVPLDWDGQIRMDPSSPYAMHQLAALKDHYDVAFACDTDHDRHGIVTPKAGLLNTNHYLSVAIDYLFRHRKEWNSNMAVGKTLVSSQMIDRVAKKLGRQLIEVPAGFKWFSAGLLDASLGFAGEESAGASFARRNGRVWTTDKDGITLALLAAEITAQMGHDIADVYQDLTQTLGEPFADRRQAYASFSQKQQLSRLSPQQVHSTVLAGETITAILTQAPGNGAAIGGLKVVTENGWFAARPSGTEDIYKIYAESFLGEAHLQNILNEAQSVVDLALQTDTAT
ncbi:phosphoglucomutase (alpha-D-glucose-1,6-bisphosphate-dependent) [soil metagenome]